ncbi:MAG: hypothetical protein ACMXYF_03775 [Candidatus Woesearchaeota archaeon]
MNHISHFYFAKHPLTSPEYIIGLILPDFIRKTSAHTRFLKGMTEHDALDKHFHNWDWFEQQTLKLTRTGTQFPTKYTLSHIALEIAIDHFLAHRMQTPFEQIYDSLNDTHEQRHLDKQTASHLNQITQSNYYHQYRVLPSCQQILQRTYHRFQKRWDLESVNTDNLFSQSLQIVEPEIENIISYCERFRVM